MRALYFKEIKSFLTSIIGYIFILIYLIASGLLHWVMPNNKYLYANLLEGSESNLIPFFDISPFIFIILIPAITMRMIAEERRSGTIELLFTRPISDLNIILAKYFAGVTLVLFSLIPTFIYYISMHYLGSPVGIIDDGATITSYIGLLLLGSVFVAIGIFSSALTNNQIVAFIIGVFLCFLFYSGLSLLGSYVLLGKFDSVIQYISLSFHYDSIMRGVIVTSDLIFFFSIIGLFIFAALTVVKSLKK
jgi:ABC-2 type transport system permease protein